MVLDRLKFGRNIDYKVLMLIHMMDTYTYVLWNDILLNGR